jgi:hypothetical protein
MDSGLALRAPRNDNGREPVHKNPGIAAGVFISWVA